MPLLRNSTGTSGIENQTQTITKQRNKSDIGAQWRRSTALQMDPIISISHRKLLCGLDVGTSDERQELFITFYLIIFFSLFGTKTSITINRGQ